MNEHIEEIHKNEVTELRRIAETTFYETFKGEYSQENFQKFFKETYNEEILLSELDNPNSFHYFYKVDNEIAGYLKLNINDAQTEPKGADYLEIQRIYFYKGHQGGGRGNAFIKLALEKACEHHKSKIWLGVWEYNDNALAFYKRHGFEVTGEHDFVNGDIIDTDLIMERNV
ncbi:GNAT family N-acetyltransferase [Staphylococcus pragensis]|uniref:GNAT family N-acetyltransferase n=1 Tax=Staphylococcus pragensis TaxID=1611836 RepID=A0A4Z1C5F7_9STAP|nr:GNAT family N-acetyltransferase [Staphylococcus pragensis]RTX90110.1 GNAT family N-acetyltransferase [Staphylococcus carnosus]TGN27551.1 GNAT family N-acetyltransferase [Staphylococcus pragensis]GGG91812.1 N-acetyltransferase [Staphylococcus pragensis]